MRASRQLTRLLKLYGSPRVGLSSVAGSSGSAAAAAAAPATAGLSRRQWTLAVAASLGIGAAGLQLLSGSKAACEAEPTEPDALLGERTGRHARPMLARYAAVPAAARLKLLAQPLHMLIPVCAWTLLLTHASCACNSSGGPGRERLQTVSLSAHARCSQRLRTRSPRPAARLAWWCWAPAGAPSPS